METNRYEWQWTPNTNDALPLQENGELTITVNGEPVYESREELDERIAMLVAFAKVHAQLARLQAVAEAAKEYRRETTIGDSTRHCDDSAAYYAGVRLDAALAALQADDPGADE
jgi:NTP pyrophosphatase (non-canonical NTP hydrolase)